MYVFQGNYPKACRSRGLEISKVEFCAALNLHIVVRWSTVMNKTGGEGGNGTYWAGGGTLTVNGRERAVLKRRKEK